MAKGSKYTYLQTFVMGVLRRASVRWPPRNVVRLQARRERGKYECAGCGELFGPKVIKIDHIDPVIDPVTGFTTWDNHISRLFCGADGLQVLCKPCHDEKSKEENKIRRKHMK